ncbi:hypothetical protein ACTXT7_017191 [Hymenolepis weldensis]
MAHDKRNFALAGYLLAYRKEVNFSKEWTPAFISTSSNYQQMCEMHLHVGENSKMDKKVRMIYKTTDSPQCDQKKNSVDTKKAIAIRKKKGLVHGYFANK